MKKTYVYFLIPLIGLIIFGAGYWHFLAGYEKEQGEKLLIQKHEKEERLRLDAESKKKAYDEAMAAQAKRKQEREDKEKRLADDRDARQKANEEKGKALNEAEHLSRQIDRLTKDIDEVKKEIAGIEDDKKKAGDEEIFLRTYVKQAEANQKHLLDVIQKIKEADEARAIAEKAAAARLAGKS